MSEWIRVNHANRCTVCSSDSWCIYNDEVVICMRESSDREKVMKDGSIGWIHKLDGGKVTEVFRPCKKQPEVTINAKKLMEEFAKNGRNGELHWLANKLGVTVESLMQIGCVWAEPHHAYAFPMFDAYGNTVGIRLRSKDGQKWSVKGSHQGVFLPTSMRNILLACQVQHWPNGHAKNEC